MITKERGRDRERQRDTERWRETEREREKDRKERTRLGQCQVDGLIRCPKRLNDSNKDTSPTPEFQRLLSSIMRSVDQFLAT